MGGPLKIYFVRVRERVGQGQISNSRAKNTGRARAKPELNVLGFLFLELSTDFSINVHKSWNSQRVIRNFGGGKISSE